MSIYVHLCTFIELYFYYRHIHRFYMVDRHFILYLSVFIFLFSLFYYLWQYLQNSDTCNTVTS